MSNQSQDPRRNTQNPHQRRPEGSGSQRQHHNTRQQTEIRADFHPRPRL